MHYFTPAAFLKLQHFWHATFIRKPDFNSNVSCLKEDFCTRKSSKRCEVSELLHSNLSSLDEHYIVFLEWISVFPSGCYRQWWQWCIILLTLQSSTFISLVIMNMWKMLVLKKPNKNVKFQSCSAAPLRGIKKFTAAQNSSSPTFMCIVLLTRSSSGSRGNGVFPE